MSLFDTNLVEKAMYVRHSHNIDIEAFTPILFYKWIWNKRGIRYPGPSYNPIPGETLLDIFLEILGDIPGDVFESWVSEMKENHSIKHIRRYFKKIVKREYIRELSVELIDDGIGVCITYGTIWSTRNMKIKFHRK